MDDNEEEFGFHECEYCSECFDRKLALVSHINESHKCSKEIIKHGEVDHDKKTNEHECNLSQFACIQSNLLHQHISNVHGNGEKVPECRFCEKLFDSSCKSNHRNNSETAEDRLRNNAKDQNHIEDIQNYKNGAEHGKKGNRQKTMKSINRICQVCNHEFKNGKDWTRKMYDHMIDHHFKKQIG